MALNADTLLDRIYLKSQARRWRIIALLLGLVAFLAIAGRFSDVDSRFAGEHIARLTIAEVIDDDIKRHELMQEIAEDKNVKALIVRINSPGGGTVGSEQIYLDLREIAKRIPVVCTMRSYAASGGYLAAIGADYILATEGTITGSVGVIMQTAEVSSLADKLGIKPITVRSGELKAAPNPFAPFTSQERDLVQGVIADFYNYFLDLVKTRRKLTKEQVAIIADGRIVSGREAVKLHLVDALGGEKEALEWLKKEHKIDTSLEVIEVKEKDDTPPLEKLFENVAPRLFTNSVFGKIDGLQAIWQPSLIH
jgi:protease-4